MGVKALLCLAAVWSCTLGIPESLIEDLSQARANHKSNHKVKRAQEIFYGNEQNKLGPLGEFAWPRSHKRGVLEEKAVEEYLGGRGQPDEEPYQSNRVGQLDLLGRRTLSPYSGYNDYQLYNMMDSRKKREAKLRRFPIFRKKRESDVEPDELMAFIRLWEAEHGRNAHLPRYSWQALDADDLDPDKAAQYEAQGEWMDGPLRYSPSDYWGRQTKRFMVSKRPFLNEDVDPRVHHRLVL